MKATTTMAVSKAVSGRTKSDKAARESLSVGTYDIDETVRLTGELVVHDEQEITPTASLMSVEFLLLTLKSAGVTRDAAMRAVEGVASEYLADWTGSKENKEAAKVARVEALASYDPDGLGKKCFDEFKNRLPKIPRAGKVVFKGTVEEVAVPTVSTVEAETIERAEVERVA